MAFMLEGITGSRYLGQALHGYGVTHVFHVPLIIPTALVEMESLGITRVMTHGEKSAVYMADGYARASGRVGVCFAQTVGAANMAAGLKDAYLAGSPVVAITGGRFPDFQHQHVYQELDDNAMFGPVTKENGRVDTLQAFPGALRQAFRTATIGHPGPVHLDVSGHFANVIDQEGELDTTVEQRFGRVPPFRPRPEPEAVVAAVRALESAARPLIVAGGGVTLSGAGDELLQLAEKLQIPVATSLNGKGTIPENHRLAVGVTGSYSRSCANQAIAEADLVFFAGSHTGSQVTNTFKLPRPGTRVIQLDVDGAEMGRSFPNEVSLIGDAKVTLAALAAEAKPVIDRGPWLHRVGELVHAWYEEF
jgi:acetolactate synthase-1/2/3 large subunit